MPNPCSAPGCRSNYRGESYTPVIKLPTAPPELRHQWLRALHRVDIENLKHVYVCLLHFHPEDIVTVDKIVQADGSITEKLRERPKLRPNAVPTLLPGCPTYLSTVPLDRPTRFTLKSKEEEQFAQALQQSLHQQEREDVLFRVHSFQDLISKIPSLHLPDKWVVWHSESDTIHIYQFPDLMTDDDSEHILYLPHLQFIECQLKNVLVHKNRRRYNVITQVMALKAHLIFPACYRYLQSLDCLSLPHPQTLQKFYSKFGLESDFSADFSNSDSRRTCEFLHIIINVWKIFNVNTTHKHFRLNDQLSKPLRYNDERLNFLRLIINWLARWRSREGKHGKLSPQTFTSFLHSCLALIEIVNHLTLNCGFDYILTSQLQNDPIEHHFGLYRMMSGAQYHITFTQILESERRIKLSSILKSFSKKQESDYVNLKGIIEPFSIPPEEKSDSLNLDPYLLALESFPTLTLDTTLLQSVAFVGGYALHTYF